jgi:hypothetical protein
MVSEFDVLDVSLIITVDYNSSHIELLVDNESRRVSPVCQTSLYSLVQLLGTTDIC